MATAIQPCSSEHSLATGQPCACCGGENFVKKQVLWDELISQWELSPEEVSYIDRQQGLCCARCGCNLRSMALAQALTRAYGFSGTLAAFVRTWTARRLRLLEINEAGRLTPFLAQLPRHQLVRYPDVDMMSLPFAPNSFNVVLHSDTLEHVPDPVAGLRECHRVLRSGGFCLFTVPIVIGRLTRCRSGMDRSYHGSPKNPEDCLVHTEYGADVWTHVIAAGFSECRLVSLEYPAAHAVVGVK